jgi:lipoprotein-anchoring transpeptidase ErfK/SrfK
VNGAAGASADRASRSPRIEIDLAAQRLRLCCGDDELARLPISTAAAGPGEINGSGGTPRGRHRIRAKIGNGCPAGAVFRARRWTGEVYSARLAADQPGRDWILSRILWLTGLESGRNRGGQVDTLRRYVYIHGCPDSEPMGVPRSHGCIRMRNEAVIWLFERVPVGCLVVID